MFLNKFAKLKQKNKILFKKVAEKEIQSELINSAEPVSRPITRKNEAMKITQGSGNVATENPTTPIPDTGDKDETINALVGSIGQL